MEKGGDKKMSTHRLEHSTVGGWTIGLTVFAGSLMILSGVFQIFQGLAAIFTQEFFIVGQSYLYKIDVTTWGWIHTIVGAIVLLSGIYVFSGNAMARGVGIFLAIISAIANFFYIPYYPVWSLLIIGLDVAIIWALASYKKENAESLE